MPSSPSTSATRPTTPRARHRQLRNGAGDGATARQRDGATKEAVHTDVGPVTSDAPRNWEGSFDPIIVPKYSCRLDGFDEAIISLYAERLTNGEIQSHLGEIYGAEVSKDPISRITDAVNAEALERQHRSPDDLLPGGVHRCHLRKDGLSEAVAQSGPRPMFRSASSTSSATRCATPPASSGRRSPPNSGPSTRLRLSMQLRRGSTISRNVGERGIRR